MYPDIEIFDATFDTYNVCILLSFLVVLIAVLLFRPKEFHFKYVFWGIILAFFFGFLGANVFNIIINASQHQGQNIQEVFTTSGMAYLGGLIFGFLALWIYCRSIGVSFLAIADYAAPFFMLERAIGRIGCLGYGCCHGVPSNLPWARIFAIPPDYDITPRHPTQAYAIICALAVYLSSRYLYKKLKKIYGTPTEEILWGKFSGQKPRETTPFGATFFYVILCYSFLRFFNEFLRAEGAPVYGPFKFSHIALFVFIVIAIIGLFTAIKKPAGGKILKPLGGAVIRLVAWLLVAGAVILFALSDVFKNVQR